jgi:copper chaperone CopZ
MNAITTYLHALDGRLRIKVAPVKGSSRKAQEIERQLQMYDGVTQVTANPTTGSVLIHYDSRRVEQEKILESLKALGYLPNDHKRQIAPRNTATDQEGFGQELVHTVVRSTMEFALQRLVYALI